jgi:hypothetical protein
VRVVVELKLYKGGRLCKKESTEIGYKATPALKKEIDRIFGWMEVQARAGRRSATDWGRILERRIGTVRMRAAAASVIWWDHQDYWRPEESEGFVVKYVRRYLPQLTVTDKELVSALKRIDYPRPELRVKGGTSKPLTAILKEMEKLEVDVVQPQE